MNKKVDGNLGNNNLIILLKTLSDIEWNEFEKFVQSPFFNKGRNYLPFLNIIKKFRPDFDSDKFNKKEVYKKLYPGKEYKESVMKSMLSRLDDIAEEFLFQLSVRNNVVLLRERFLLNEISRRGLKTRAEKIIRETDKFISGKKIGILDFVWGKDYVNEVLNHYHNFNERTKKTEFAFKYELFNIYSFLSEFLINESLLYSQKIFWPKDINTKELFRLFDSFDFERILDFIKMNDKDSFRVLNIFYLLRMSSKYPDKDNYYFELKNTLFDNFDKIDLYFKKYFLNALTVISSAKTIEGKEEFRRESFNLRKKIYDENLTIFSDEHYLKNGDFRTSFIEALNLNEIKWAEEFSVKYLHMLQPEYREDINYYCKACLSYANGMFDEALHYAVKVNINQITYKLDMKNLISKIYFDTGSVENLISLLNTYYQLINNSRSHNKNFLARHFNFVKYLRQLLNIKLTGKDDAELSVLYDNIKKENVTSKSWLLKKIISNDQ